MLEYSQIFLVMAITFASSNIINFHMRRNKEKRKNQLPIMNLDNYKDFDLDYFIELDVKVTAVDNKFFYLIYLNVEADNFQYYERLNEKEFAHRFGIPKENIEEELDWNETYYVKKFESGIECLDDLEVIHNHLYSVMQMKNRNEKIDKLL